MHLIAALLALSAAAIAYKQAPLTAQGPIPAGKDIGALYDNCCVPKDSVALQEALLKDCFTILTNTGFYATLCHPKPGTYDFANADRIALFAQENALKMRGHTLVWHEHVPEWFTQKRLTRGQAAQLLEEHIRRVVLRFAGRMYAWDVVNEAVDDNARLRDSEFARLLGPGYITDAFRWAHEADTGAILFYNDYDIEEKNAKSDAVYRLLSGLLAEKVPVHGVGFQCHFAVDDPPDFKSMRENIARFATLGLVIHFTEIDVRIKKPFTDETLARQEAIYRELGRMLGSEKSCRAAVFWGLSDRTSWIPRTFSGYGAACPFDENYQAKPAFNAFMQALNEAAMVKHTPVKKGGSLRVR